MHKVPKPKSQAKILRNMFADAGVNLGHRQALDNVARLHGYPSWNTMSPVVAPKKPLRPKHAQPDRRLADSEYQFEAIAYLQSRKDFVRLNNSEVSSAELWTKELPTFQKYGLHTLEQVGLSEDDEQTNTDIKVFVYVKVTGRLTVGIRENESPPEDLARALNALAAAACCASDGTWMCVPEDNWEMVSED
jgi:hypothetical protein